MLAAQRRAHLLDVLARDGRIVAKTVADDLGISEDSIRRDLRELADDGLVQRVYGGALPVSPAVAPFAERQDVAGGSKSRVARAALRLIRPGSVVILDGGTTAAALARMLPDDLAFTAITHSPTTALALAAKPAVEIELVGGRLSRHSMVGGGATAIEAIGRLGADLFLLGVTGVHPDAGLTTGELEDAAVKRALAARAEATWVLASEEKLGAASRCPVLGFEEIDGIVADVSSADRDLVAALTGRTTLVEA
ncbi:DeoR/GlpR family DNA-binding transcription regulator [Agromyces seonyuensis]|uniref:Lactose phosphotransferase system repressor n=1 Tax=Agromyces seonyuensis TaxID=2662446 RepID=A0A6I4P769_9MICO|nr:DeoR/GlpR family DNA-binding transcription regulator [Agromyces seonyuensis]MWB99614.1 DeoR family transcriptional regulator [Agromyces seonyuensis]